MTHLHTDHAGGLSHFPKSEILIHRPEFKNASGLKGKARGFLPHRWPDGFAPRLFDLEPEPVGPFPHSLRVSAAGDVRVLPTHGHTRGHVSVMLEEGPQELMVDQAIDGVAPDERAARETLHRIRDLAIERPLVYLPSHDPGAATRLEARQIVARTPGDA